MFMPPVGYAYAGRFSRGLAAIVVAALFIWSTSHLPFGLLDYRPIAVIAAYSHFIAAGGFALDLYLLVRRGRDRSDLWYQELTLYIPLFAIWIAIVVAGQTINQTKLLKATEVCHSSSWMEPTIRPKECVIVVPNGAWKRGDIVMFFDESDSVEPYFGRIAGLPKDVVAIHEGTPVVNGIRLPQTPAFLPPEVSTSRFYINYVEAFSETNGNTSYLIFRESPLNPKYREIGERQVLDGHFYLLSDAREWGKDSRSIGDLPISRALGKPIMVSRSPEWSRIGEPVR